ncbi:three-helix bundle dimerization domain-containing protein [Pseudonocardia spinosispora]|uniref:three-helix bundle dimerization domain-containing protein n=1 Tax=Pseudonocardia spinosispora TaxID=103441 RepID=UPI00041BAE93|nr:hypothetical protein [Pseudonocardia spinosispora]
MSTSLDAPNLETLETRQVDQQLSEVEERLVARYSHRADLGEDTVRAAVAELRERYSVARVRSFLPIIIERAARARFDRHISARA